MTHREDGESADPEMVRREMYEWIEEAVIGLDLCPFAAQPLEAETLRVAVVEVWDFERAVRASLDELERLVEADPDDISTTLVAFSRAFSDFETFLDAAAVVRELVAEAGLEGVVQVATFHPDYRFADTRPNELGNYTNRAPYPTLHFLREADVTEAVEGHPDPDGIPQRNIETLESMGREAVEAMWEDWKS
jgi:hypothetical protein